MTFQKKHPQFNTGRTHFKKGHTSWLKGTKGIVKPNKGSFKKGEKTGKQVFSFNNGLCFDKAKNRWLIWCKDKTYVSFSRAVIESILKKHLDKGKIIHHINRDSLDDNPDNLVVITRAEHQRIHKPRLKKENLL